MRGALHMADLFPAQDFDSAMIEVRTLIPSYWIGFGQIVYRCKFKPETELTVGGYPAALRLPADLDSPSFLFHKSRLI